MEAVIKGGFKMQEQEIMNDGVTPIVEPATEPVVIDASKIDVSGITNVDTITDEDNNITTGSIDTSIHVSETVGVVTNCVAVYVRKTPSLVGDILGVLNIATSVTINKILSNDEFYSVMTSEGIRGYCKKEFITLK